MAPHQHISFLTIRRLGPIRRAGNLVARFKFPQLLACLRIQRIHEPIHRTYIHAPIQGHRRSFNRIVAGKFPSLFASREMDGIEFAFEPLLPIVIAAHKGHPIGDHRRRLHRPFGIKLPQQRELLRQLPCCRPGQPPIPPKQRPIGSFRRKTVRTAN